MDTKFSVALHILVMIGESKNVLSSQMLASSVGTNASYIRKVIALLKNAGLIVSRQGRSGYRLSKLPADITLLEIYFATQEVDHISLFQIHQNAAQDCPVGKYIAGAMTPIFSNVEQQLAKTLSKQTLADVCTNLYRVAAQE